MVVVNDITKIKDLELYTQKVRSMYFSSIAHELRTPLNSILPMLDRLDTYVENERGQTYLKIIKNSAIHLLNLVSDALDLGRIENNQFKVNRDVFNIRKAIKDVTDILEFPI